jgi:hypothetical protein
MKNSHLFILIEEIVELLAQFDKLINDIRRKHIEKVIRWADLYYVVTVAFIIIIIAYTTLYIV